MRNSLAYDTVPMVVRQTAMTVAENRNRGIRGKNFKATEETMAEARRVQTTRMVAR